MTPPTLSRGDVVLTRFPLTEAAKNIMAEHSNKHIQEAIRYAESHGWVVHKLAHGPIFGVCCGVHTMRGTAVASISCRRRGVLKTMRGTSAAPSTAVPIRNARYRSRRQVGAGCNEREDTIMKEHEFTLILTTDPSEEEADRLYGCCNDGTLSTIAGVPQIHFHRAALSLEDALRSAIRDVRAVGFDVERVEMEPEAVTQRG